MGIDWFVLLLPLLVATLGALGAWSARRASRTLGGLIMFVGLTASMVVIVDWSVAGNDAGVSDPAMEVLMVPMLVTGAAAAWWITHHFYAEFHPGSDHGDTDGVASVTSEHHEPGRPGQRAS